MNTTLTNDLCNEVRDLREQLAALREQFAAVNSKAARYGFILNDVLTAGRPTHSAACDCDQCLAWLAVRKELRDE